MKKKRVARLVLLALVTSVVVTFAFMGAAYASRLLTGQDYYCFVLIPFVWYQVCLVFSKV